MPHFQAGQLTRRDLLVAASALVVARPTLIGQGRAAPISAKALNHVTLTVKDPKRSLEFYQRVFGLPVVATQGVTPILRVGAGPQFIALGGGPDATPRIDHLCLTVDGFDADRLLKTLADHGVQPLTDGRGRADAAAGRGRGLSGGPLRARVRMRGESAGGAKEGTPELYFGDPDGITIQLQAVAYCGGAGRLGEVCSAAAAAGKPPLVTRAMNHVTVMVADVNRSVEFYQRLFGLPVVAKQGPIPILRIGSGPSFIALGSAAGTAPAINHVCLTVENFDAMRIMATLADLGIRRADGPNAGPLTARVRMRGPEAGGAKEGTPELYFTDPDGITIQLQDATYCGGSGVRGNVCSG